MRRSRSAPTYLYSASSPGLAACGVCGAWVHFSGGLDTELVAESCRELQLVFGLSEHFFSIPNGEAAGPILETAYSGNLTGVG